MLYLVLNIFVFVILPKVVELWIQRQEHRSQRQRRHGCCLHGTRRGLTDPLLTRSEAASREHHRNTDESAGPRGKSAYSSEGVHLTIPSPQDEFTAPSPSIKTEAKRKERDIRSHSEEVLQRRRACLCSTVCA